MEFDQQVVIITGANGGIGQALCQSFLLQGAFVVPFYRKDLSKLDCLFEWLKNQEIHKERLFPVEVEITQTDSVKAAIKTVYDKYSRIDVLVNNAGKAYEIPFLANTDLEIEDVIESNFISMTKLSREVLKYMMPQKSGNIVNISSTVGDRFGRGVAVYAAMKSAVNRLSEVLAIEMGKKGIRVNTVSPGVVETTMSTGLTDRHEKFLLDSTPLRRYAKPQDIADAVTFLASSKASFVTGTNLFVDGGIRL